MSGGIQFRRSDAPHRLASPVNGDPWHCDASRHLLSQFQFAWGNSMCSVCKAEKWVNAPFCRACCIKLQRVGLLRKVEGRHGLLSRLIKTDWRKWDHNVLRIVTFDWDRARDYLITRAKMPDWLAGLEIMEEA